MVLCERRRDLFEKEKMVGIEDVISRVGMVGTDVYDWRFFNFDLVLCPCVWKSRGLPEELNYFYYVGWCFFPLWIIWRQVFRRPRNRGLDF